LLFPANSTDGGPHWDEDGNLLAEPEEKVECEEIEAVLLGDGLYVLAERHMGSFSSLRLHWGDRFQAEPDEDNQLVLKRILLPQAYVHIRSFAIIELKMVPGKLQPQGSFNNDNPIAQLVHELHGGWETVAGAMLTLSIPKERTQEFWSKLNKRNLHLGLKIQLRLNHSSNLASS
jgi:hypothetical protein